MEYHKPGYGEKNIGHNPETKAYALKMIDSIGENLTRAEQELGAIVLNPEDDEDVTRQKRKRRQELETYLSVKRAKQSFYRQKAGIEKPERQARNRRLLKDKDNGAYKMTDDARAFVREHYTTLTLREMSDQLGVTVSSISSYAERSGLMGADHFTEAEKTFIRAHYPVKGCRAVAGVLGKSATIVRYFAKMEGIRAPHKL